MNLKMKFILLIFIITSNLFSVSQFGCSFIFINASARDAAFGLESGTAGLRYLSPTSIGNNPAKLGAFSGVGYEYSYYDYAFGKYAVSTIAFGWKGIGLCLPMINSETKFGTTLKYYKQTLVNEEGVTIDEFTPYENNSKISIGVDVLQWSNYYLQNSDIENCQNFMKLYIGYSHNFINSRLAPDTYYEKIDGKSSFSEYGLLVQYYNGNITSLYSDWDFTFGMNFVNPGKAEIVYVNENNADNLPYGIKYGFSGCYSFNLEWFLSKNPQYRNSLLEKFTDKTLVIYTSYDKANYGGIRKIAGYGFEVSLFDIISYRIGYTKNYETDLSGLNYSLGINLEYCNRFGVALDYTKMFKSSEVYSPKKLNFIAKYIF